MSEEINKLYSDHVRSFHKNRFVYPVVSRRSQGISIGVNLNPDKVCNFDCIYCQVDRRSEAETRFVEMDQLLSELEDMLELLTNKKLFQDEKFKQTPEELRVLKDIAFSGDGEPSTFKNFDEIIDKVSQLKTKHHLDQVKMVLITNATMFHRPVVKKGLEILDQNQGEVWAKLDAGTEEYYHLIDRTKIPFSRILDNLCETAKVRPIVIQTLLMNVEGVPPSSEEIQAYCKRLNEIRENGGKISHVQIHTIARVPTESYVTAIKDEELDKIAETVRQKTGLAVEVYYGKPPEALTD
jgi:wyosine [tRNA(Phe)-imidazoG37] synthetase (radical SAM superfamily)